VVRIAYDPREVWKRIIPFQGIPLLSLLYSVGVANGYLAVRSATGITIAVIIGLVMYALMMAFMLNALRNPVLLSMDDVNMLSWKPTFSIVRRHLPSGTTIEVSQNEVKISPYLKGIPATKTVGNVTIFPLPKGLKELEIGIFTVK